MKHDRLWKDVLWTFFREFLELFLPKIARELDFTRLHRVDKELFKDLPDSARREADLIVEAQLLNGDVELILIHIEIQARRESDVSFRMMEYYSLIRGKRMLPVFPIVVYLCSGAGGIVRETYKENLFGINILRFNFIAVGLPDLQAKRYENRRKALAPAVSSLMQSEETDKVARKLRAYERLNRRGVKGRQAELLYTVVDQYLPLSVTEEAELIRRMKTREAEEVTEMLTRWKAEGIEIGVKQGILEGQLNGKRETLIRQMTRKFGELPENIIIHINGIDDVKTLDELADRVIDSYSLEGMRLNEI